MFALRRVVTIDQPHHTHEYYVRALVNQRVGALFAIILLLVVPPRIARQRAACISFRYVTHHTTARAFAQQTYTI